MHGACLLVNAVDDPVGSAAGTVTSGERAGQWLADPVKIDGERGVAELEHGCGDGLGQALRDRAAGGWLEADVVPAGGLGCHAPVAGAWQDPGGRWPGLPPARRDRALPGARRCGRRGRCRRGGPRASRRLRPAKSRSREADPGNLRLLSRHAAGTLASLAGTGAASARGRLEVAGEGADAGERVRNAAGLLDPGQVPGSRDYVTSADGISAAVCCPWLTGRGLCAPRTKATGTLMAPGDPAKPPARCPATEATGPAHA